MPSVQRAAAPAGRSRARLHSSTATAARCVCCACAARRVWQVPLPPSSSRCVLVLAGVVSHTTAWRGACVQQLLTGLVISVIMTSVITMRPNQCHHFKVRQWSLFMSRWGRCHWHCTKRVWLCVWLDVHTSAPAPWELGVVPRFGYPDAEDDVCGDESRPHTDVPRVITARYGICACTPQHTFGVLRGSSSFSKNECLEYLKRGWFFRELEKFRDRHDHD